MSPDDESPGDRWRGATWVEFCGVPWDGTMVDEGQVPLQLLGKITEWPRGTTIESMRDGASSPLGEYHPVDWADEELSIVKLEWRKVASGNYR
jgi:hypothetical protein